MIFKTGVKIIIHPIFFKSRPVKHLCKKSSFTGLIIALSLRGNYANKALVFLCAVSTIKHFLTTSVIYDTLF
jgi:hypothetical protein